MKQRKILNDLSPDFARDGQTQEDYISSKQKAIVDFTAAYTESSGADGIVIGISGGIDSFLVGCICALACQRLNKKLLLVALPNGEQHDYADVLESARVIREIYPAAQCDTISIENGYLGALKDLRQSSLFTEDSYSTGNIQPRLRMTYQYALAKNLLVAGTDHAAESITGFFTKYGDGGTDINPIQDLVKNDIYAMSKSFGAPPELLKKQPSAGLGITATDEAELGLKYADICAYLKGASIDEAVRKKLEAYYRRTMHKRSLPASLKDRFNIKKSGSLVVVDLITAFIDGELPCVHALQAVENTVSYINSHPWLNVLYARDFHPENHCSFKEHGGQWNAHAVGGTNSPKIHPLFYSGVEKTVNSPIESYNVFNKGQDPEKEEYSAFNALNSNFGRLGANLEKDITVVGAATEYCVKETALSFLKAGFSVSLPADCLAYVDKTAHEAALKDLAQAGAKIL